MIDVLARPNTSLAQAHTSDECILDVSSHFTSGPSHDAAADADAAAVGVVGAAVGVVGAAAGVDGAA